MKLIKLTPSDNEMFGDYIYINFNNVTDMYNRNGYTVITIIDRKFPIKVKEGTSKILELINN